MSAETKLILLSCSFLLLAWQLQGGTYIVSPTGANNDQNIINEAIKAASESGGGTVYLNTGVYLVDGTVIIKSNIKLIGDQ